MDTYYISLLTLIAWAGISLIVGKSKGTAAGIVRTAGSFIAAGFGLYSAVRVLAGNAVSGGYLHALGSGVFALDGVSAFFMLPLLILTPLCSLYGEGYLTLHHQNKGSVWFFFYLLAASMLALLGARDSIVFLVIWEIMSLSSFFLVITDKKSREARYAGLLYFAATHIGTAFLLVFFFVAGRPTGATSFAAIAAGVPAVPAGVCFILALIGFGTKAGIVPLHIWLPEAHPAAPSHTSAIMSGVMIKMGVYGILRTLILLGPPPSWWGVTLMAVGGLTAVAGILFAVSQHDLKRLLAYSSVENVGLILLGIGIGIYGIAGGMPLVAALGLGGGLLHVLNHALFKGLLFLGAGSVISAGGTGKIDAYGGLIKSMPLTGTLFILGSAAICGLPPLNGFISEFLMFTGAIRGIAVAHPWVTLLFTSGILVLGFVGGLAAVCFTKAGGILFLGESRIPRLQPLRESGPAMTVPMVVLAVLILAVSIGAGQIITALELPVTEISGGGVLNATLSGIPENMRAVPFAAIKDILNRVVMITALLAGFVLILVLVRFGVKRKRKTVTTVTWDCGYTKPSPGMQYTASSFAQPLVDFFRPLLRTRKNKTPVSDYYPAQADFSTSTPDFFLETVYGRIIGIFRNLFERVVKLQHGSIHLYILYIVAALVLLLVWKLR